MKANDVAVIRLLDRGYEVYASLTSDKIVVADTIGVVRVCLIRQAYATRGKPYVSMCRNRDGKAVPYMVLHPDVDTIIAVLDNDAWLLPLSDYGSYQTIGLGNKSDCKLHRSDTEDSAAKALSDEAQRQGQLKEQIKKMAAQVTSDRLRNIKESSDKNVIKNILQ